MKNRIMPSSSYKIDSNDTFDADNDNRLGIVYQQHGSHVLQNSDRQSARDLLTDRGLSEGDESDNSENADGGNDS